MHYRVGIATDPQPEDPYYRDENEAVERARLMHEAQGEKTPVAVWTHTDEMVWLYLRGRLFRPA